MLCRRGMKAEVRAIAGFRRREVLQPRKTRPSEDDVFAHPHRSNWKGNLSWRFGRPAALPSKLVRELGFGLLSKLFQAGVRDIPLRAKR